MNNTELIALYFNNKLTEDQKLEFNKLMENDIDFAKEVTFHKNLKTVITKEEQEATKQQLKKFETEHKPASFNIKKWLVAASLIVLLGLSFVWFNNRPTDTKGLYAEYYEPYRNVVQPIVRGDNKTDLKTRAFTAYENKDYNKALQLFNAYLDKNPEDNTIVFYKAVTLMQLNKHEEAITTFENNYNLKDRLKPQQQWYLALAYLKNNNVIKAKTTLTILKETGNNYKKEAVKKLLKSLRE